MLLPSTDHIKATGNRFEFSVQKDFSAVIKKLRFTEDMPCDSHIHRKVITPGTKEGDPGSGKAMPYQSLPGVHPAFCKLSALLCSEANHDACWKQTVLYDIQNSLSLGCGKKKQNRSETLERKSGHRCSIGIAVWKICLSQKET